MEFDNIVHHVLANPAHFAIDCRSSTPEESPSFWLILWDIRVGMVEISDGDNPVIDPHVRDNVEQTDVLTAEYGAGIPQRASHGTDTDVRSKNEMPLLRTEKGAARKEMTVTKRNL